MKRICVFFGLLAVAAIGRAQCSLYDKYSDIEGVTSVYITKAMFELFSAVQIDSDDINMAGVSKIASQLDNLQIISSDKNETIEQLRDEASKIGKYTGYEELLRVKEDGEKVAIYCRKLKDNVNEFVLVQDDGGSEFTIVIVTGRLLLSDFRELIKNH